MSARASRSSGGLVACDGRIPAEVAMAEIQGGAGGHVLARLDVSFDAARLRGVRVGAGRLPPDVQVLRVDGRGASLLTQSGRDFTLSDYGVDSFTSGWMGSCL